MDKVRFGRALGYGARHAARTLAQAVDAATAPGPSVVSKPAPAARSADEVRENVVQATATVLRAKSQVRSAAQVAGKSALAPVARFSSVLWLEVTGSFFALVALVLGQALWKRRELLHAAGHAPGDAQKVLALAAMFVLFAYFAVSSFVRARRRQRR